MKTFYFSFVLISEAREIEKASVDFSCKIIKIYMIKKKKMIVPALALGVATVVGAAEISHVSDGKLIEDQKNALIDKEE